MNPNLAQAQLTNKVSYYVLLSTGLLQSFYLKKLLSVYKSNTLDIIFAYLAKAIWFPLLYGCLKVRLACYTFCLYRKRSRRLDRTIAMNHFQNILS